VTTIEDRPAASAGRWMEEEIASQPAAWRRAAGATDRQLLLPATGERIAVVGCGTSWFAADAYARLRESRGRGASDAFAASEMPDDRDYDAVVVISRSGTTTEIIELLTRLPRATRRIGVIGDTTSPAADLVDEFVALDFADERSVVQTRFPTTFLALARAALGEDVAPVADEADRALAVPLDPALLDAEQFAFLGRGWTVGVAHEAALKLRESVQLWTEAYPAMEYRHGPISIAAPGRITWSLGAPPAGLADEVAATGGRFIATGADPLVDLVTVHRVALARARLAGLDPDRPRHLTRSVVLGA
jgi:fructoselysine-6-P-deglycase FrlB-like protein